MKKYIVPVVAFLLIGTIANAQTEKKTAPKMTAKPATTAGTSKTTTSRPATKMAASDSTHHAGMAMKRKTHPKATSAAPKKTATK
ncbi:MAG: hypothetical protein ABI480_01725 [Chitinophagaceae bacterium]